MKYLSNLKEVRVIFCVVDFLVSYSKEDDMDWFAVDEFTGRGALEPMFQQGAADKNGALYYNKGL